MQAEQSILWRRLDRAGHEAARLIAEHTEDAEDAEDTEEKGWRLEGTAVFLHEKHSCRLDYAVHCNSRWETTKAHVTGWIGEHSVHCDIVVDSDRQWRLNGIVIPEVAGCIDVDLNFSPSTNTLPIRRLHLPKGAQAEVQAAWLRFPSFRLERLSQRYRRLGDMQYRYESVDGKFVRDLAVNEAGLVTLYPDFWTTE